MRLAAAALLSLILALPASAQERIAGPQLLYDLGEVDVFVLNLFGPGGPTDYAEASLRGSFVPDAARPDFVLPYEIVAGLPVPVGSDNGFSDVAPNYEFDVGGQTIAGIRNSPDGGLGSVDPFFVTDFMAPADGRLQLRTPLVPSVDDGSGFPFYVDTFIEDDRGTPDDPDDDLLSEGLLEPYRDLAGVDIYDQIILQTTGNFSASVVSRGFEVVDLLLDIELDGPLPVVRTVELFSGGADPTSTGDDVFNLFTELAFEAGSGLDFDSIVAGTQTTPLLVDGIEYDEASLSFFTEGRVTGRGRIFVENALAFAPAPAPIPLPATLPLLLAGLVGLGVARRRRRA